MNPLLALFNGGGSDIAAESGTYWVPYYVGGGALILLLAMVFAVMAFGKGREHS